MTNGRTLTDEVEVNVDIDYTKGLHVIKNFKGVEVDGKIIETSTVTAGDKLVWYITVFNKTDSAAGEVGTISNIKLTDEIEATNDNVTLIDLTTVSGGEGNSAGLEPDNFILKVNQYAQFKAEYTVTEEDIGKTILNTATARHDDHEHSDESDPVPVAGLEKSVILSEGELPTSLENVDFDLYGVDFPGSEDIIIGEDEEITLLYKLTAIVPVGTTYYLSDEGATYIGSDVDGRASVTGSDQIIITATEESVVSVYVCKTYTASNISSDGKLTNIAKLSASEDDKNAIEATEEVPAEVEEPEEPGFDFDIDIGVIPAPVTGAVSVTKTVSGLVVSSGAEFKFSIYDDSGSLVETIRLEAGQSRTIDGLAPGTYTIVETGSAMLGYSLRTYINGSYRPNGSYEFEVYAGEETGISVNNRYTVAAALNTNDHFAYIVGYSDGTVKPNNPITRAEVATIFFRLMTDESREAYWSNTNTFDDVSADKWYNNAISTLQNAGILDGTSFRPNDNITRAELAVIATKFSRMSNTAAGSVTFTDVQGHWAQAEIEYAAAIGWVKGYSDGTFRPDQQITRAEAMTLINRVLERAVKEDGMEENMVAWPDNTPDAWYYEDVQEATNFHYYVRAKNQPVEGYDFNYEVWRGIMEPRDWTELEKSWAAAAVSASEIILS